MNLRINAIIRKTMMTAVGIQIGDKTDHHDQSMTLHNFRTTKAMVKPGRRMEADCFGVTLILKFFRRLITQEIAILTRL